MKGLLSLAVRLLAQLAPDSFPECIYVSSNHVSAIITDSNGSHRLITMRTHLLMQLTKGGLTDDLLRDLAEDPGVKWLLIASCDSR